MAFLQSLIIVQNTKFVPFRSIKHISLPAAFSPQV